MDIMKVIQEELNIRKDQVEAVVTLIDEGNTIPFIARYRKEMHGGLSDEVLRNLDERLRYLRGLEERKATVLASIAEQGKLTPELEKQIQDALTLVAVEDLYRPYKQKRRTRATMAKEKGLEPLANLILMQQLTGSALEAAKDYVDEEKGVTTPEEALVGAQDIIAENISDSAQYRTWLRRLAQAKGKIISEAKSGVTAQTEDAGVYEGYFQYERVLGKQPGHATLALNRGEKEKFLTVKVVTDDEASVNYLCHQVITKDNPNTTPLLQAASRDAYERLIWPSIERELRNELTEKAEEGAIRVFGKNLQQLLMQPPIVGKVVLGWDPAFRTGCKLAVVDGTGKVLDGLVIYPTAPQNKVTEAKVILKKLVDKYDIDLISVGNGTASRESEQVIASFIREMGKAGLQYVIVNEAGASVYSASKLATEEFPKYDVGQRSAISIARRLQDPLAELVKIDPRSIGVGQYQHDMNQKKLSEALQGVVEDCVNAVGVDLNTASVSLLEYVSGISKTIAKNIVAYREANGKFTSRKQLLKVDKLGPKAYQQCAGFLRIRNGEEPLDGTAVHPESYETAKAILKRIGATTSQIGKLPVKNGVLAGVGNMETLSKELEVGEMTLTDICKELVKPSRDPRDEMPKPILRQDVMDMEQLKPGMQLKGTVRNVIDFGAFVDIGVHQDGLVHISQMTDRFIKHPMEVVSVGDVVDVTVMSVDLKKKRIQLTMKKPE